MDAAVRLWADMPAQQTDHFGPVPARTYPQNVAPSAKPQRGVERDAHQQKERQPLHGGTRHGRTFPLAQRGSRVVANMGQAGIR